MIHRLIRRYFDTLSQCLFSQLQASRMIAAGSLKSELGRVCSCKLERGAVRVTRLLVIIHDTNTRPNPGAFLPPCLFYTPHDCTSVIRFPSLFRLHQSKAYNYLHVLMSPGSPRGSQQSSPPALQQALSKRGGHSLSTFHKQARGSGAAWDSSGRGRNMTTERPNLANGSALQTRSGTSMSPVMSPVKSPVMACT